MQAFFPLKGVVQDYAWGGKTYIADLLSISDTGQKPLAEYWMGTHPKGPSEVEAGGEHLLLNNLIDQNPEQFLGVNCSDQFKGVLPYLFKVLDVEKMLSIQVHPSKAAAEVGFAEEEAMGIPRNAGHRNFKDDNHKPELMWAMTDFWLLHGFRSLKEINEILQAVPEFEPLRAIFEPTGNIATLYRHVMEMPEEKVNEILSPLHQRLEKENELAPISKHNPDFWALRAFRDFTVDGNYDRGLFSVYLLNLVFVNPGEVVFQDAGVLHAYLEGVNMELMANSDNVLRGGLTPKHVDVPELMKHVVFEPVIPKVLEPVMINEVLVRVDTPAPDFQLSCVTVDVGKQYHRTPGNGPEIYFVSEGQVKVNEAGVFGKGQAFFVPDYGEITIEGKGRLFCAGVPLKSH